MAFKWSMLFLSIITVVLNANAQNNNHQTVSTFTPYKTNEYTCVDNEQFVWCIPKLYNTGKEPWRYRHLTNTSFPWMYEFYFWILDVQEVNDELQTVSISMYLIVKWLEPRLIINASAADWKDIKFGSPDVVTVSPEVLQHLWKPDLEIIGMDDFKTKNILKEVAEIRINITRSVMHTTRVDIIISCQMNFDRYPLDSHECFFRIGSYINTDNTVRCTNLGFAFNKTRQRSLQYNIKIGPLPEKYQNLIIDWGTVSMCGFNIVLNRNRMQIIWQVYLTSMLFVIVSWVSFIIMPEVVPGRMGLLVTTLLVLINIFNGVKSYAPKSKSLNVVDLYLISCIGQVFMALIEYAVVLFGKTHKRRPSLNVTNSLGPPTTPNNIPRTTPGWNEQHPSMNKLDSLSLCIFPIIFTIFNIVYYIIYI